MGFDLPEVLIKLWLIWIFLFLNGEHINSLKGDRGVSGKKTIPIGGGGGGGLHFLSPFLVVETKVWLYESCEQWGSGAEDVGTGERAGGGDRQGGGGRYFSSKDGSMVGSVSLLDTFPN